MAPRTVRTALKATNGGASTKGARQKAPADPETEGLRKKLREALGTSIVSHIAQAGGLSPMTVQKFAEGGVLEDFEKRGLLRGLACFEKPTS